MLVYFFKKGLCEKMKEMEGSSASKIYNTSRETTNKASLNFVY